MTNQQQPNLFERIIDELKAGNPLYYVMGLFVLVMLITVWVWQTMVLDTSVVVRTPHVNHPTAEYMLTLTAQARQGGAVPQPLSTPKAAFFYNQMFSGE